MSGRLNQPEKVHLNKKIAIFASGTGSNARRIIEHFEGDKEICISLIVCNKPGAGVLNIASEFHTPVLMIAKDRFSKGNGYVDELKNSGIDFIVLAGFLWKIPEVVIQAFRNKIINIHPSLLPKYGGKGMYGSKVHEAVIAAGEKESGITIHYVDEHYDNGDIIFQATCPVLENDTADTLAEKIHKMEHENFPRIVEECVRKMIAVEKE